MSKIKKIILGATMLIFIFGAYNTTFASNSVSWNDINNYMQEKFDINMSTYQTIGLSREVDFNALLNLWNNCNGFCIIKNDNKNEYSNGGGESTNHGDIHLILSNDQTPIIKLKGQTISNVNCYCYEIYNTNGTYMITFDSETKKFKSFCNSYNMINGYENYGKYQGTKNLFRTIMNETESATNFFSENKSRYILNESLKCAKNMTIMAQDIHTGSSTWAYSLTVVEFEDTPAPWEYQGRWKYRKY